MDISDWLIKALIWIVKTMCSAPLGLDWDTHFGCVAKVHYTPPQPPQGLLLIHKYGLTPRPHQSWLAVLFSSIWITRRVTRFAAQHAHAKHNAFQSLNPVFWYSDPHWRREQCVRPLCLCRSLSRGKALHRPPQQHELGSLMPSLERLCPSQHLQFWIRKGQQRQTYWPLSASKTIKLFSVSSKGTFREFRSMFSRMKLGLQHLADGRPLARLLTLGMVGTTWVSSSSK